MPNIKKGDIVIICSVIATFILSIVLLVPFSKQGSRVIVKQDNKVIYEQSINVDNIFDTGTNTIVIEDGAVYIKDATCKNRICINTGKISKKGESIVCLPNKVIVEID